MALTVPADLTQDYSSIAVTEVNAVGIMRRFANRRFESRFRRGLGQMHLVKPNYGVVVVDRNRDEDYKTANEVTQSWVSFRVDSAIETDSKIGRLDLLQAPVSYLNLLRQSTL